ncbi:MAG: CYTH domain-containing protein [Patescibacteria group bacterium]|nr:CYTH domain-containing protein [Patescibacteria group bacterium]
MNTEVEIRGPLTETKYKSLLNLLKKKGKLVKESDQLAIFFKTPAHNLSLKGDHSREKLVLKFGGWQKGARREIEVFLEKGQFGNALELLKSLGYTKGHKAPAFRQDFLYRDVQISLKTKAVIGPHFEMETASGNEKSHKKEQAKLRKIAKSLGLKVWTERQYRIHTTKMWEAFHPGPEDL